MSSWPSLKIRLRALMLPPAFVAAAVLVPRFIVQHSIWHDWPMYHQPVFCHYNSPLLVWVGRRLVERERKKPMKSGKKEHYLMWKAGECSDISSAHGECPDISSELWITHFGWHIIWSCRRKPLYQIREIKKPQDWGKKTKSGKNLCSFDRGRSTQGTLLWQSIYLPAFPVAGLGGGLGIP